MFKYINQCDVYVGLWCIYMLQEVLYSPGIINQLIQLVMLLWAMIALFKHLFQSTESSSILNATLLLIAMYVIYGVIHIMFGSPTKGQYTYYYLQSALNSLAPIYLFYSFARDGKLTSDRIRIYLPILVFVCILLYYKTESQMLLLKDTEEITNNGGYFFLPLIPFLFFYSKKPILQYVFWGIILLYLFMGMKRGAILIGVVVSMVFLYANLKNSSRVTRFILVALTIILVSTIFKYIEFMMHNSDYFLNRVEETIEGKTSGRDVIYGTLWRTTVVESSPFNFYFGRGADSTIKLIGTVAHQDWLETFCNNGLLGVFILSLFFYVFAKNVWISKLCFPSMMFYSFASLFIIIFCKTLFSMSIQDLDLSQTMLLGYFAYWMTHPLEEVDEQEMPDSFLESNTRY